MFQRMLLGDSAVLFTIAAFSVAFSIFATVAWRAIRMRPSQLEHFSHLPFETETPASKHECRPESPAK